MKIEAMSVCHQETMKYKFGPDTLVSFFFFQLNYKISRVQGRRQMLIYLDFGTAAHEIAKKWFKQTEIKMQSYGLKASQRTRNKGQGQMPTHPAVGSG